MTNSKMPRTSKPSASKPSDEFFPCLMVRRDAASEVACQVESIRTDDLPAGDVLIEVAWSSLNYKDALACHAHPGVVRKLPHVPGIDCAGTVVESDDSHFQAGDQVLVTGHDLGSGHWGGLSARVRVPGDWVVAMPEGLNPESAMIYGTAGFTAAQSVDALLRHGITSSSGEVVVTGATGGVGSIAVALLAKLGYQVTAVTGKPHQAELLQQLGAKRVIGRDEVDDCSDKPLLAARWAGGIDTVGGNTLATLLRSTQHRGCIAACGLVAGDQLPMTIYPFILRGVTLAGIDSAQCPRRPRIKMWQHLATDWSVVDRLENLVHRITLSEVPASVEAMLAGKTYGRTLVRPVGET